MNFSNYLPSFVIFVKNNKKNKSTKSLRTGFYKKIPDLPKNFAAAHGMAGIPTCDLLRRKSPDLSFYFHMNIFRYTAMAVAADSHRIPLPPPAASCATLRRKDVALVYRVYSFLHWI